MLRPSSISRRQLLICGMAGITQTIPRVSLAAGEAVSVYKDPHCGCCSGWVAHLRAAGYSLAVDDTSDLDSIKTRLGIPRDLWACHTALAAGYAIEGHVPAHALARLLAERPSFKGMAVPGMPIGSPGMEGGREDIYEVIGFDGARRVSFGRYRGRQPA